MGNRRISREIAVQFLYSCDINSEFDISRLSAVWEFAARANRLKKSKNSGSLIIEFSNILIQGIINNLETIDQLIEQYAANWKFSRITYIDRNILRLATFEILYMDDIPPAVSIDEAIDIAKKYSTLDSGKFVNGILDKIKGEINNKK
ncbi:transcription antitermination factor NusB [bacterium]|nr:transcription antitermination factor NusB [bacterium]